MHFRLCHIQWRGNCLEFKIFSDISDIFVNKNFKPGLCFCSPSATLSQQTVSVFFKSGRWTMCYWLFIHSFMVLSFIQSPISALEWIGMTFIFKNLTVFLSILNRKMVELLCPFDPQHRISASAQQREDERTFLWLFCGGDCLCFCKNISNQHLYFLMVPAKCNASPSSCL